MGRNSSTAVLSVAAGSTADGITAPQDPLEQQLFAALMAVLPVAAAAVITTDASGELHVGASSGELAESLALVQLQAGAGPCLQASHTGRRISIEDLHLAPNRWSVFAGNALRHGFLSAVALPLRVDGQRLGVVLLVRRELGPMPPHDLAVGRALADIAATGLWRERVVARSQSLNRQLQTALDTRIIIEQAKGLLAERGGMDVDQAFDLLRSHARKSRESLSELASAVVNGADTSAILPVLK